MLRAQAEKKNITLVCDADTPAIAACDTEQITQVLLNLLLNAIQLLPQNGKILVQVSKTDDHVIITVADNGPGIAVEQREHIFDPFFSQRAGGVGLGLAVVRQIVMAHHGQISVHTSDLGGAEFRVKLPISGAAT
jgi:signal transduction histidine kinase